jgi:translation elongation factor EF-G
MNDLISNRRGRVEVINDQTNVFGKIQSDRNEIQGIVPLIETVGYSTYLRSISKGEASFLMKFK